MVAVWGALVIAGELGVCVLVGGGDDVEVGSCDL